MTRLSVVIASIYISTAFNVVYGYPGSTQVHRLARSPHYGGFGMPPPPPPPPFPFFQTNNWSGITKGADGNTHGVYSGAAASASNNGPSAGHALSLASADCDDDDSSLQSGSSGKLITGFGLGNSGGISRDFGGHFSAQKEASYSFQSGGKFNADHTIGSQGHLNLDASGSATHNIGSFEGKKNSGSSSLSQNTAQVGSFGAVDQSEGFSSSNAQSSTFGKDNDRDQHQVELASGGFHSQNPDCEDQEQTNVEGSSQFGIGSNKLDHVGLGQIGIGKNIGLSQSTKQQYIPNPHKDGLSEQGNGFRQQTSSYGQHDHVNGAFGQHDKQFGQQSGRLQEHDGLNNGGNIQQTQQSSYAQQQGHSSVDQHQHAASVGQTQEQVGFGGHEGRGNLVGNEGQATLSQSQQFDQQNLQGGNVGRGQTSHGGYGNGFSGYGNGFSGYGNGFSGYGQHDHIGSDFKYQTSQDLQQQSKSALTSSNSESSNASSKDTIGGALNLASQSLDAAQKAGCTTCGNSGYAVSNAKSHSGSAIAVAIGG